MSGAKTNREVTFNMTDATHFEGKLKAIGGSNSDDWNTVLANETVRTLWLKNSDEESTRQQSVGAVAALIGIAPRDELEGMMAAQMVAAHHAAMECYRRAMIADQTFEGRKENLNQANRLSRTLATLVEALDKDRGKGQQQINVKHVHVHEGGQAIVGNVSHPGGGVRPETEDQPHAKQIADAPEPAMRCENPVREPVPVPRDEER